MAGFKKFTAAQKRQYWANKGKEDAARLEKAKANFKPIENPSPYQLSIFQDIATGEGHTVVDAVAGSGKSTTLINGLTYVPSGLKVAFCAFARANADELKERCPVADVDVDTTHAFGARAIRRRWRNARLDKYKLKNTAIQLLGDPNIDPNADPDVPNVDAKYFNEDLDEKISQVCKAVGMSKQCLALDANAVSDMIDQFNLDWLTETERKEKHSDEALEMLRSDFIQIVLKIQRATKEDTFTYDFDDMVFFPVVHKLTMDKFDLLMVDETQDLNKCQMALILMMLAPGGRIIACGDERQAIYLFRAADQHSMSNLVSGLKAKRLPLSVTYRCAKKVVEYVKGIVNGLDHLQASPTTVEGEVNTDVSFDTLLEKIAPGDFVISRLNAPIVSLAMYLLAHNKPCNIRGKDLGEYFRYFIKRSKCKTLPDFMDYVSKWRDEQLELLNQRKKKPANLDALVENIHDRTTCMLAIAEGCSDLKGMIQKLETIFTEADEKNIIILGSVHKLKGAERDTVWMLNSTFKHGSENIEEDNLIYVASTRAKRTLNVVQGKLRDKSS